MLIAYQDQTFQRKSLEMIDNANKIIADYRKQGYTLSLRQLYYQFVSRDLIPNNDREYKKLGDVVTNGRMAGLISWQGIEDRGRSMLQWPVNDEDELVGGLADSLSLNLNEGQEHYVEVWVEKDALSSVIGRACALTRTPYMACKGYLSASEAWRAGLRMKRARDEGQTPVVIHLGDHDPSGIDMTRDNMARLELFSEGEVIVDRIALNRDQIDRYNPPENPTKLTDSRAEDYISLHGYSCWELDALEPSVLVTLIRETLGRYLDQDLIDDQLAEERDRQDTLRKLSDNWSSVQDYLATL